MEKLKLLPLDFDFETKNILKVTPILTVNPTIND